MINYDGRRFRVVETVTGGEASSTTFFDYRQRGDVVWATYSGGSVRFGTLIANCAEDGSLDMRYQHLNVEGEFRTGKCRSIPEVLDDGRLRVHERWEWTSGATGGGESMIEEIRAGD